MTAVDLERLYESKLKPRVQELEARRRGLRNTIVGGVVVAALGAGSCWTAWDPGQIQHVSWWRYGPMLFGWLAVICFGLAISRFLVPGFTGYANYRALFKKEIVAEAVRALLPGTRYFPDRSIPKAVYDASGLFTSDGKLTGDDLLQGSVGDTPFEACELNHSYTEGSDDNKKTVPVFHGLFLRIDMDRDCAGRTLVQPAGSSDGGSDDLQAVSFDPAFDDLFMVSSSNPAAARALLDPDQRARLIQLSEELRWSLHLSFSGAQALAALQFGHGLFEPSLTSGFDLAAFRKVAEPLQPIPEIVAALGLEKRRRPPDPRFHAARVEVSGIEGLAGRGNVGMGDLIDAMQQEQDKDAGPAPMPPANPWARVNDSGSELSVEYPIGFGTLVALAIGLGLTPLVFALLVNWLSPTSGARLASVVLAARPGLGQLWLDVREYPTGALLGAAFVWWMFLGTIYVRPGTVTVSSDGVRIRRTGRPWTSQALPFQIIRGVQHSNRSIHFVRNDRGLLRSFVQASPNLPSDKEAGWVVHELRRGLRRAGWRPPKSAPSASL